jgi:hypothetical protein
LNSSCHVSCTISRVRLDRSQPLSLLALSQDKYNVVSKWVNDAFPRDLDDYSAASLFAKLISKVSVSLLFLQYTNEDERPQHLDAFHEYVTLSTTVLQALASITQNSVLEIEESSSKVSQKARKHAKRTRQANKSIDVTPFRALHLKVPDLRHEGMEMALEILMKQKEILLVMFAPYSPTPRLTFSHSRILTCSALNQLRTRSRETISHLPLSMKSLKTQAQICPTHKTRSSRHPRRSLLPTLKFNR